MKRSNPAADANQTQSLARALQVLRCFTREQPQWSISELARVLQVSKPTAMRLCRSLEGRGFLARNPARRYELSFELVRLANVRLLQLDLHSVARPYLKALARQFDETAYLGVLAGNRITVLSRVDCTHPVQFVLDVGSTLELTVASMGRVVLAHLPEAEAEAILAAPALPGFTPATLTDPAQLRADLQRCRELGYALSHGERIEGVAGVAAPIFGWSQRVTGALALSIPMARLQRERVPEYVAAVQEAAGQVSRLLGYTGG